MPRNTLSWVRCDICGRRTPTVKCLVGGRSYNVCPYCGLILLSLRRSQCNELKLVLPKLKISQAGKPVSRQEILAKAEALMKSVDRSKKTTTAKRSTGTAATTKSSSKRRYYKRKKR